MDTTASRALLEARIRSNGSPHTTLTALTRELAPSALLRAIAGEPAWLAQVAANSHRHDNGFDKIVLSTPAGDGAKLVLHVWDSPGRENTDNIHNHRWDFASVVLCGQVRTELYDDDPDGVIYPMLRYASPGAGASYTATAAGERRVGVRATLSLSAGSDYVWHKDVLHRAYGTGAPLTATLIVQGRPERQHTTVLVRSATSADEPESRPLHRLGPDDVARALVAVAESMRS